MADKQKKSELKDSLNTPLEQVTTEENNPTKELGSSAYERVDTHIRTNDLKNPIVGKLLLQERDKLIGQIALLEKFRSDYYGVDKTCGVLEQKIRGENKFQILYSFCLALAGVIVGIVISLPDGFGKVVVLCVGVLLFIVSICLAIFMRQ